LIKIPHDGTSPTPGKEKAWYQLTCAEALAKQESQLSGLNRQDANARLMRIGANQLPEKAGKPGWPAMRLPSGAGSMKRYRQPI